MPLDRYYIDAPLCVGTEVHLTEDEAHHLLTVSKGRLGELVQLVNGKNVLASALIIKTGRNVATLAVKKVKEVPGPSHEIILAQAIPRINRLDMILEKATELGMTKLLLFPGEQSERPFLSENQQVRSKKIVINAMKQCGRLDLPQIHLMPPLREWSEIPHPAYFGDVETQAPLFSKVWIKENRTCFFVGPESGFSVEEVAFLRAHHVKGVKLHSHILRTDTAPLMALSLISHWVENV